MKNKIGLVACFLICLIILSGCGNQESKKSVNKDSLSKDNQSDISCEQDNDCMPFVFECGYCADATMAINKKYFDKYDKEYQYRCKGNERVCDALPAGSSKCMNKKCVLVNGQEANGVVDKNNQSPSSLNIPSSKASDVTRDEARERYAETQKKYQNDIYAFSIAKWPDLKQLIEINRDLQVTLIDSQSMKFYYLLEHYPSRIIRNNGVSAFVNFDWTDTDDKELKSADLSFVALDEKINKLKTSNNGHPMWPELRNRFRSVMDDNEYISITNSLKQSISEVEQLLRGGQ